jgi:hypothetical protein
LNIDDFFNVVEPGNSESESESESFFPDTLESFMNFSRGLPRHVDLRDTGIAAVFRRLLIEGSITVTGDGDVNVDLCHRKGWIHAEMNPDDKPCYTFPSPLHAAYVAWRIIPLETRCQFGTVRDMSFAILKNFTRSQLQVSSPGPSHFGVASSDRPLEPYEFYRGLFPATGASALLEGC